MAPPLSVISRRDLVRRDTYQAASDYWLRVHRRAMACRFEITLAGEDAGDVAAARAALDQIDAIEAHLTVFRESSTVTQVNRTAASHPVTVDDDLFDLLQRCRSLHDITDGAFDVTSTPLSRCWGFLRREGRLPTADEIGVARDVVGMRHVVLDPTRRTVRFNRAGVELNLGAIGKGWALDRVADTLRRNGVSRALLSAGHSSIHAIGSPAGGWPISLSSPRLDRPFAHLVLHYGALATSGAGEQYFEIDGKRYGHIIDPRTGWPARGALSVSVVSTEAAVADALSTAFFVGGLDLARRYCAAYPFTLVVLVPDEGERRPVVIGEYPGADVEIA
jgi:thiamine biosynthesis lipoprotein